MTNATKDVIQLANEILEFAQYYDDMCGKLEYQHDLYSTEEKREMRKTRNSQKQHLKTLAKEMIRQL